MYKLNRVGLKQLLKNNELYLMVHAGFNCMSDMVENVESQKLKKVVKVEIGSDIRIYAEDGHRAVVFKDRNSFQQINIGKYKGINVYNCVNNFSVMAK